MDCMVKITVDGTEVLVNEKKNLIDALKDVGVSVPHFCYHPKLEVVGMCRLCMVEIGSAKVDPATKQIVKDQTGKPIVIFNPKMQAACNTPVTEGMYVNVNSEKAKAARAGVMEFQLINHPLDCPVCDKAGECALQDYSFSVGDSGSRFREHKRNHPVEKIGTNLRIVHNRCILCYRCVRFERDIVGRDDLELQERGNETVIGYTPLNASSGPLLDTNYQGALADLCPVGALLNENTLFQSRVWWYDAKQSICHGCSELCHVTTNVKDNELYRYMPPKNPEETNYFICDAGRFSVHEFSRNRLHAYLLKGHPGKSVDILPQVAENLLNASKVAIVGGSTLSNEEVDAIQLLVNEWRNSSKDVAWEFRTETPMWENRFAEKADFLMMVDRRPNSKKLLDSKAVSIGERKGWEEYLSQVDLIIVLNEFSAPYAFDATRGIENSELYKLFEQKDLWKKTILVSTHESAATKKALASLPVKAFPEMEATYTRHDGQIRKSIPVLKPVKGLKTASEVLASLSGKAELARR